MTNLLTSISVHCTVSKSWNNCKRRSICSLGGVLNRIPIHLFLTKRAEHTKNRKYVVFDTSFFDFFFGWTCHLCKCNYVMCFNTGAKTHCNGLDEHLATRARRLSTLLAFVIVFKRIPYIMLHLQATIYCPCNR